jgi:hypothetical protein
VINIQASLSVGTRGRLLMKLILSYLRLVVRSVHFSGLMRLLAMAKCIDMGDIWSGWEKSEFINGLMFKYF